MPQRVLRKVTCADKELLVQQQLDPDADWLIGSDDVAVATGGVTFHYDPPYGDLYTAAHGSHRRGHGSYMVQELKRIAYEMGKITADRCSVSNTASRNTLQKAGMLPCCPLLQGKVAK